MYWTLPYLSYSSISPLSSFFVKLLIHFVTVCFVSSKPCSMFLRISGRSSGSILVAAQVLTSRHRTIEEAVLPLGLTRPLSLPLATRCVTALALWTALTLVVLSQLSRIYLVLLELTTGLRARRLGRRSLLGLEVGIRHACAG